MNGYCIRFPVPVPKRPSIHTASDCLPPDEQSSLSGLWMYSSPSPPLSSHIINHGRGNCQGFSAGPHHRSSQRHCRLCKLRLRFARNSGNGDDTHHLPRDPFYLRCRCLRHREEKAGGRINRPSASFCPIIREDGNPKPYSSSVRSSTSTGRRSPWMSRS